MGPAFAPDLAFEAAYDLVFGARTRVVRKPMLIEADADGELAGLGRWRCSAAGLGLTAVDLSQID